jgi:hypothetical protein|nr:MAG TPA: hypothetical protein [Caudoviricetes sp.]
MPECSTVSVYVRTYKTRDDARAAKAKYESRGFPVGKPYLLDGEWWIDVHTPVSCDIDNESLEVEYRYAEFPSRGEARKFKENCMEGSTLIDRGPYATVPRWVVKYPGDVVGVLHWENASPKNLVYTPAENAVTYDVDTLVPNNDPVVVIFGSMIQIITREETYTIESDDNEALYKEVFARVGANDFDGAIQLIKDAEKESSAGYEVLDEENHLVMFDGELFYYGVHLTSTIAKRIEKDAAEGTLDDRYIKFLVRLLRNPSAKSVEMLYDFMQANDIDILPDGRIKCFRGVTQLPDGSCVDYHSGKVPQYEGCFISMPRNFVEDNPEVACSHGLHCASAEYAKGYGVLTEVAVDPADVVSVPYDYDFAKCRCCRFEILMAPAKRTEGIPNEYVVDRNGNVIEEIFF